MSSTKERLDNQKKLVDTFFNEKQSIGFVQKDGSITLTSDEAQLITEFTAFQSAKLLKAKLNNVDDKDLNERGLSRKRRSPYLLANTISYIVNQKLDSNMAKDPNYTPTLAEHLSLITHVGAELFKSSLSTSSE